MILQRLLLVLCLVLTTKTAYAEGGAETAAGEPAVPTMCSGELRYQWVRTGESEPQIVTFMTLQAKGKSAEDARTEVTRLLESAQVRALENCRSKHENLSGCVAAKMSSNSTLINALGFAAKKALQDAIVEDCKNQVGICSLTKTEDPKCSAVEVASIQPEGSAKEESKKSDKKK